MSFKFHGGTFKLGDGTLLVLMHVTSVKPLEPRSPIWVISTIDGDEHECTSDEAHRVSELLVEHYDGIPAC